MQPDRKSRFRISAVPERRAQVLPDSDPIRDCVKAGLLHLGHLQGEEKARELKKLFHGAQPRA